MHSRHRPSSLTLLLIPSHMLLPSSSSRSVTFPVCLSVSPSLCLRLPPLSRPVSSAIDGAQTASCPAASLAGRAKRPQQSNERSCCSARLKNKSRPGRADTLQTGHIHRLDPKSDAEPDTPAVTVISTIYWPSSERWEYQLCERWTTQSVTIAYSEICTKKKNLLSPFGGFCSLQRTSATSQDCGELSVRLFCGQLQTNIPKTSADYMKMIHYPKVQGNCRALNFHFHWNTGIKVTRSLIYQEHLMWDCM